MVDLKKKFIDILFEDDDNGVIADKVLEKGSNPEEKKDGEAESKKPEEPTVLAKDILYRKSSKPSAFINLQEPVKKSETPQGSNNINNDFEFSSQISPIFGLIKENKVKMSNYSEEIKNSQTNRPNDSHLEIITSPIYGYGNKEDAIDNNYNVKGIDEYQEESQLHELFDTQEYQNVQLDTLSESESNQIDLESLFGDKK